MKTFFLLSALASLVLAAVVPTPAEPPVVEVPPADLNAKNTTLVAASLPIASVLSSSQLASFAPYTQLARAAYCPSIKIADWNCGEACRAISGFQPTLTGGDGNAVQLFFVGFWPERNTVVVAFQGTDPTQFLSLLTDIDFIQRQLDPQLFPGIPSSVYVHDGFADQHSITANTILGEVKRLISSKGATSVTVVGHSLGGALAELSSLQLRLSLPSNIAIKTVTYGTPRVGNDNYAAFFDSKLPDFARINNELDPIPIVPGRGLGFTHPKGEVHIVLPDFAVSCPGNDNDFDLRCTIPTVPNIVVSNILNHLGPYQGIFISTLSCY